MNSIQENQCWRGKRFFIKDLHTKNIAAGIVAGIFVITGPTALILEASLKGNFTGIQTIQWVSAVYVFGGLLGIILPLYFRIPIVGGNTITGVAFLATVTAQFTFNDLLGAYIVSGLLMFLMGITRFFAKLMHLVRKEIISAMLAGMITKYMINFVHSTTQMFLVGLVSLGTFFLFFKRKTRFPPVIAAYITGSIVLLLSYPLKSIEWATEVIIPQIQIPNFNLLSFLSVSLPLALIILSNDAAVGIGALEKNNYRPSINQIISLSGFFSILAGFFGGQSANIAGIATAICSDEEAGPKEKRYVGAIVSGVLLLLFGLLSWKLVPLIQAFSKEFISIIVGFSLLGVFANNLYQSFSRSSMKLGPAFSFIIALSNIEVLNISAPVWSLLVGTLIVRYIENEKKDFGVK